MRHLASIGMLSLALAGCQSLPSVIRIEIDGSTLELKKKPTPPDPSTPDSNGSADAPAS